MKYKLEEKLTLTGALVCNLVTERKRGMLHASTRSYIPRGMEGGRQLSQQQQRAASCLPQVASRLYSPRDQDRTRVVKPRPSITPSKRGESHTTSCRKSNPSRQHWRGFCWCRA
ncbi:hypothetical protein BU26DRAFT_6821 [Trematosphaeria pertusa]|uniref:Uncharacterized protein n=1 Tax=Trematosphaeria pertusa TaxID=390896 RepID=A0A6A6J2P3_9PLEO|nr:uncharacterized protein BU26DRAFT_6821 [Trematosphaeria pertusa]KAF2255723.1 hypothetical protein BU26DRAFT_6821 [Trematosphaeria pertusa]